VLTAARHVKVGEWRSQIGRNLKWHRDSRHVPVVRSA
jgi:hypothetical protein